MKYSLFLLIFSANSLYSQVSFNIINISDNGDDKALVCFNEFLNKIDTIEYLILYTDYGYFYNEELRELFFWGTILVEISSGFSTLACRVNSFEIDHPYKYQNHKSFNIYNQPGVRYSLEYDKIGLNILYNNQHVNSITFAEIKNSNFTIPDY